MFNSSFTFSSLYTIPVTGILAVLKSLDKQPLKSLGTKNMNPQTIFGDIFELLSIFAYF